jgi:flagellar hook-associated protein FlgK
MVSLSNTASIALSGMNAAQAGLQVAAHNIANSDTAGFRRQQLLQVPAAGGGVITSLSRSPQSGESLETDMVGLLQAKNAFLANLAVFRAGDRMAGTLLDTVG